jgi:hypothetical protein
MLSSITCIPFCSWCLCYNPFDTCISQDQNGLRLYVDAFGMAQTRDYIRFTNLLFQMPISIEKGYYSGTQWSLRKRIDGINVNSRDWVLLGLSE